MAEQTFKSPGFFEREIEIIKRPVVSNSATPVGLVGPAKKGPAFVPTTVYSQDEFIRIFGEPDRRMLSGHAAAEFFRNNGQALTFCRTLGSGHWNGSKIVKAGFKLTHTDGLAEDVGADKLKGAVHFITAKHKVANSEFLSLGLFSDNDSHTTDFDSDRADGLAQDAAGDAGEVELIRAMIFTHKDYTVKIDDHDGTEFADDLATTHTDGTFKIKFSNGTASEDIVKVVSLNPDRDDYISKVLNTDSLSLDSEKHYLYAHFAVDDVVASPVNKAVAVLHGKAEGGYEDKFGNFSSAFIAPETPSFISQPFGTKEYDLFHFESLDDGAYASDKYKVSISNLRASTDPTDKFGTFSVAIRDLRDSDESPVVYESYNNCSLNPDAENFVGRVIGDQKVYYSYKNSDDNEKRLVREGAFANVSTRIRVVVSDDVMLGEVPETALPFGFRGVEALLTNNTATDSITGVPNIFSADAGVGNADLDHSVLPPLPYRFKVTKGSIKTNASYAQTFTGQASASESVDLNLHWGLNSRRVKEIDNPNGGTYEFNELLANYLKFMGADSDVKTSGTLSDSHNNNKFSLAKVSLNKPDMDSVSGTINDVFKDAVYIRNADPSSEIYDAATHTINMRLQQDAIVDGGASEKDVTVTLAKLLAEDPVKFNKYSLAAKFTAPFSGGFDGLNIFDSDSYYMTDKGSAIAEGGKASSTGFSSPVKNTSTEAGDAATSAELMQGFENTNNVVASFKNAIRLMTDGMVVNHNVLVVPGIRDAFITDFAKQRVEEYGKAIYLMDIPYYDKSATRTFVSEKGVASARADVEETSSRFDLREINSSYVAAYFPDALVLDSGDPDDAAIDSRRSIRVPSSIVALGALAKTDSISSPWFAPAGFSRGALDTITSTCVRLNAADRDTLYEARINPIANFPNKQFVIFGQKTSQLARTALDRVNVRRLVLEVKRQIEFVAQRLLFEQNNSATRNRFVSAAANSLSTIRAGKGIEDFRVIMDDTNNTAEDVDNNRLNGRIVIVPTRAIEFVAIDFVITNAGVEFP